MSLPIACELALLATVLVAGATIAAYTLRTGISPMPSLPAMRHTLLAALPAPGQVRGTVYELGAGWGTLALPLARRYPDGPVVAYELSPLPWAVCALRARLAGLRHLSVRRRDFLHATLADAGLVVCYLEPRTMARLRPRLEATLPAGARVVCNTFAMPGWRPSAVQRAPDLHRSPIYVYAWPEAAAPAAAKPEAGRPT